MVEAGINVSFGHDDIMDIWNPLGTGNMLQVLHIGLHVCQMMGYSEINESIDLITNNSARTLNISDKYGMEVGKPENMIILSAKNGYDAIRRQVPVYYSIREGKLITIFLIIMMILSINRKNIAIQLKAILKSANICLYQKFLGGIIDEGISKKVE